MSINREFKVLPANHWSMDFRKRCKTVLLHFSEKVNLSQSSAKLNPVYLRCPGYIVLLTPYLSQINMHHSWC